MTALLRVLRLARVGRIEAGWGLVCGANVMGLITLLVFAYEHGGPALVALCTLTEAVAGALAAIIVSHVGDRLRLDHLLRGVTALGALLLGLAAIGALVGVPAAVVVMNGASAVGVLASYRPVQAATLPWLVATPRDLAAATVAATALESTAALLGPVAVGAMLLVLTPAASLIPAAVCAALSLVASMGLSLGPDAARPGVAPPASRSYAAGLVALWRVSPGGGALLLALAQTFARGVLNVLVVLLVLERMGAGQSAVAWLWAALGVGALTGATVGGWLLRVNRAGRAFGGGVTLWGLGLVALSLSTHPLLAAAAMFAVGAGNAFEDGGAFTLIPRRAGPSVASGALGALELVAFLGLGAGAASAPSLAQAPGISWSLLLIGVALVGLSLVHLRPLAALDRREERFHPGTELIRQSELFDALPLVVVEQLAESLRPHEFRAGEVIVREGDRGDCVYLIEAGHADVYVRGVARPALGPGDSFGEIALLHDTSRTATVVAADDVSCQSLSRDLFLSVIQGRASSAEAVAGARLERDSES